MKLYSTEVADAIKQKNIIHLAERFKERKLESGDQDAIDVLDNFAKEIGKTGRNSDSNLLMSELIKKTVEPIVFSPDESILDIMFDRDTVGEFDESKFTGLPKNTIVVYDAVRGGNVPKSYVDPKVFSPNKFSLQAETEIDYSDLRRNGWKSISKMAELARNSFEQEAFYRIFDGIDSALAAVTGDQNLASGSSLTPAAMDAFTRYIRDMNEGSAFSVGLSKYIDPAYKMDGAKEYMSEDMKNELNRFGRVGFYDGVKLSSIPTAKKSASGKNLILDKRIFGVAGKIGELNLRGEMRNYETYDHDAEKVRLKFTGYDMDYVIYYLDKIARITFS